MDSGLEENKRSLLRYAHLKSAVNLGEGICASKKMKKVAKKQSINIRFTRELVMQSPFLFVYGTLKSDATNPHAQSLHHNAKLVGAAKWPGLLCLVSNYPGAVRSNNSDDVVLGELWKLNNPQSTLSALDEYEECSPTSPSPHEYIRSLETVWQDDKSYSAWVYIYNLETAHLEKILDGNFLNQNQKLVRRQTLVGK